MDGADVLIRETAGMGPTVEPLTEIYSITCDTDVLSPGAVIPITLAGPAFTGFLLYATTEKSESTGSRVGSFEVIDGSMAAEGCAAFTLDSPTSVLTHSAPGEFVSPVLMYTAPLDTEIAWISFNAIIVQKLGGGGYNWGILKDALVLNSTVYAGLADAYNGTAGASLHTTTYAAPTTTTESVDVCATMTIPECATVTKTETIKETETMYVLKKYWHDENGVQKCKKKTSLNPYSSR